MAKTRTPLFTFGFGESKDNAIHSLSVEGFKSLDNEQTIELRPLTVLAGANSSGKSSTIQPLLLLKQTLEAAQDPGALLLNGPNVKFTQVSQLLSRQPNNESEGAFVFGITLNATTAYKFCFRKGVAQPVELEQLVIQRANKSEVYRPGVTQFVDSPLKEMFEDNARGELFNQLSHALLGPNLPALHVHLIRDRCFLEAAISIDPNATDVKMFVQLVPESLKSLILSTIHVPGLRGNPQRNYPVTAVGNRFPGLFEGYVASVIAAAERGNNQAFLDQLGHDLRDLGLAWKVQAFPVDDTQVELRVSRFPNLVNESVDDLVSIADVGFGVSQTLPVVVALLVAQPGQLVYIEQPEIHLHPRAQHAMATLLARAATRGVRVVIETHSSLLLLGIQRTVAAGTLDPALVKLHWFQRDEQTGMTNISSADLDDVGAFGAWPEDFDDVTLSAQQQYLDDAEKKLAP